MFPGFVTTFSFTCPTVYEIHFPSPPHRHITETSCMQYYLPFFVSTVNISILFYFFFKCRCHPLNGFLTSITGWNPSTREHSSSPNCPCTEGEAGCSSRPGSLFRELAQVRSAFPATSWPAEFNSGRRGKSLTGVLSTQDLLCPGTATQSHPRPHTALQGYHLARGPSLLQVGPSKFLLLRQPLSTAAASCSLQSIVPVPIHRPVSSE